MGQRKKNPEHEEQKLIVKYLKQRGVIFFAVPNGVNKSIRQAMYYKAEGLMSGVPDLIIMSPPPAQPERVGVALEMKSGKGKYPSPTQKEWLAIFHGRGFIPLIGFGAQDALTKLKELGY